MEVYEQRTQQWLGRVRLARPLSFSVVCIFAILLLVLTAVFLIEGTFTRKTRLSGVLAPIEGAATLSSPGTGVMKEIRYHEGQAINQGDVIAVIDTERQSIVDRHVGSDAVLAAAQIALRERSAEQEREIRIALAEQHQKTIVQQLVTSEAEIAEINEEINLQQRRVQIVQKMLERYRNLKDEGFFTEAQLQAKQDEVLDLTARMRTLERTRLGLQRNRETMLADQKISKMALMSELSQVDRTLSSMRQERVEMLSRRTAVITAPCTGKISGMSVQVGQSVRDGQPLGTIIPTEGGVTKLQAQLYAPSKTVGFLQPGQAVYLRYAAFPYQKFGLYSGTVTNISTTPFAINELPANLGQQMAAQSGSGEALYRVDVRLDKQDVVASGRKIPLKPGLTLEGDVRQETRKLWELLFEPLLLAKTQIETR